MIPSIFYHDEKVVAHLNQRNTSDIKNGIITISIRLTKHGVITGIISRWIDIDGTMKENMALRIEVTTHRNEDFNEKYDINVSMRSAGLNVTNDDQDSA